MMDRAARFRMSTHVVTRDVAEGSLLVNVSSGATWKLNKVGTDVCQLINSGVNVSSIIAKLARNYDVTIETLEKDIEALLGQLRENGIIQYLHASGSS